MKIKINEPKKSSLTFDDLVCGELFRFVDGDEICIRTDEPKQPFIVFIHQNGEDLDGTLIMHHQNEYEGRPVLRVELDNIELTIETS